MEVKAYERVADKIRQVVEEGSISPGDALPSERQTAERYGVSRSTVRRAWRDLESMGYIVWADQSSPTVVGPSAWPHKVERSSMGRVSSTSQPGFLSDLMQAAVSPARYNFEIGMPDPDLLPVADFQRIMHELFSYPSRDVFGYSPTTGLTRVRQALREEYLARRQFEPGMDQILVTAGSLQGLDLLTRLWVKPGDVVITENPTFAGALHVFRAHGAQIVGIPIDAEGMQVDLLETAARRGPRPKFVYVQPIAQNPTGVSLSPVRRRLLLEWANHSGIPIIEDDAYGFLADHPPLAATPGAMVVYLNTLSKILSPGIRVGCLVAPPDLIRQLVSLKQLSDLHTSTLSQLVAEGWLRMGDVDTHISRARAIYASRLKTALKVLETTRVLTPFTKAGLGFYLFTRLETDASANYLHQEGSHQDLLFAPGEPFGAGPSDFRQWIRIAVGAQPTAQIETGLRRLARLVEHHT